MKYCVPFIIYFTTLILITSCGQIEKDEEVSIGTTYINFDCKSIASKADIITNENIKDFGIFSYNTFQDTWSSLSTPNYMYNIKVSRENEIKGWNYNPKMYWPKTDYISFFAVAPYNTGKYQISDKTKQGLPIIKYQVHETPNQHQDIIYSYQTIINSTLKDNPTGLVPLHFAHSLSLIKFKAKLNEAYDEGYMCRIHSISIEGIQNEGELSFSDFETSSTGTATTKAHWTPIGNNKNITTSVTNLGLINEMLSNTENIISNSNSYLMPIPQKIKENVIMKVLYDFYSTDGEYIFSRIVKYDLINYTKEWEVGKVYTYSFNYSGEGVIPYSLSVNVSDWDNIETEVETNNTYINVKDKYTIKSNEITNSSYKLFFETNTNNLSNISATINTSNTNLKIIQTQNTNNYYIDFPYLETGERLILNSLENYIIKLKSNNITKEIKVSIVNN